MLKLRRLRQAIREAEDDLARGDHDEIDADEISAYLARLGTTGTGRTGQ